jgi:hypothetical protein
LYPDSVFQYGIGWYFLGIFLTDTKGKLGKDLWYRTLGGNPFFPCFCPHFDGPSPPFEGSSHKISQNGAPAKSYSTKNTVHTIPNIPTGKCRYLTDTGQTASKQMGYNFKNFILALDGRRSKCYHATTNQKHASAIDDGTKEWCDWSGTQGGGGALFWRQLRGNILEKIK